jgi:hypothetical protein
MAYNFPPPPPRPPAPPSSIEVGLCTFPIPPLPFELPIPSLTIPTIDLSFDFTIDFSCPLND